MINLQQKKYIGVFGLVGILLSVLFFSGVFTSQNSIPTDAIHRGNSTEPESLDPQIIKSLAEANISRDIFEGLTAEASNGAIIPGVAEKWETSKDQTKWTFFIRKNAKWSNGEPVTANDFVYSFRRALDPKTAAAHSFLLRPILNADKIVKGEEKDISKLGITAINDHTLEIQLEHPIQYLLRLLANHVAYPIHQKTVEAHKNKWTRPENIICNGPYIPTEWVPQSHIKIILNENYWDKDQVKVKTIFYYPTEDRHAELKRFISGEIHTTESIPQDQIEWIEKNMTGSFRNTPFPGIVFYGFNMTIEPFKSNHKLRQALALAIDRNLIADKIIKLSATAAKSWIPDGMETYQPQGFYTKTSQEERERKAIELYKEAGFSETTPLKVEILFNTNDAAKNLSIAIAGMWKKVLGVDVALRSEEWKVFVSSRAEKKFQIIRLSGVADFPIASAFLEVFLSGTGTGNSSGYENPEFDSLVKAGISALSIDEQNKLFAEAEKILLNDLPIIPLYHATTRHLVNPSIQGWMDNFMNVHPSRYLYFSEKK